jgi:hypothetical protein
MACRPHRPLMRLARGRTRWFPGGCHAAPEEHVGGGGGAPRGPRGEGAWAGDAQRGGLPRATACHRLQPLLSPRSLQSAAAGRLTVTRAARVCFLFPQARLQQRESSLLFAASAAGVPSLDPREPLVRSFTPRQWQARRHPRRAGAAPAPLLAPPPAPARYRPLLAWGVLCVHGRGGGTARRLPAHARAERRVSRKFG